MSENSLVIFSRGAQLLAEADTVQKTKELKDLALTATDWAKRKGMGEETIQYCRSYALEAERKMGEMLLATERAKGGQPYQKKSTSNSTLPVEPALHDLGISKRESSEAQQLATLPKEEFEAVKEGKKTRSAVKRDYKRKTVKKTLDDIAKAAPETPTGKFDLLVIDPPWPVEKIERDVRPNQVADLDYPTMSVEKIFNLELISDFAAKDCHVFLWTTQKMLPVAFQALDKWDLRYVVTFVWHKPGGFQPIGLPQFNCEFCVYARKGKPEFIDAKNFFTCFEAARGKHSEKPEEFYALLRRVTAGRRLDCFNRRKIDGFIGWGKEAK